MLQKWQSHQKHLKQKMFSLQNQPTRNHSTPPPHGPMSVFRENGSFQSSSPGNL